MNVLIVGPNSFIGKTFRNTNRITYYKASYKNIELFDLSKIDSIINCAIHPDFKSKPYNAFNDLDLRVARRAHNNGCHYVMISSRKVYGNSRTLKYYDEESPLKPFDFYSENKAISESRILELDNTTVLRGSNLFGFEYRRNSFMGYCMNQLKKDNKITYTLDPTIKRDFIDVETSCDIMGKVCQAKLTGLYNLSANYGLPLGDFADYLIRGYGSGSVEYGTDIREQFIIDNTKLKRALNIEIGPFDYEKIIGNYGKQLCKI